VLGLDFQTSPGVTFWGADGQRTFHKRDLTQSRWGPSKKGRWWRSSPRRSPTVGARCSSRSIALKGSSFEHHSHIHTRTSSVMKLAPMSEPCPVLWHKVALLSDKPHTLTTLEYCSWAQLRSNCTACACKRRTARPSLGRTGAPSCKGT